MSASGRSGRSARFHIVAVSYVPKRIFCSNRACGSVCAFWLHAVACVHSCGLLLMLLVFCERHGGVLGAAKTDLRKVCYVRHVLIKFVLLAAICRKASGRHSKRNPSSWCASCADCQQSCAATCRPSDRAHFAYAKNLTLWANPSIECARACVARNAPLICARLCVVLNIVHADIQNFRSFKITTLCPLFIENRQSP